jgi:hypothetical protein
MPVLSRILDALIPARPRRRAIRRRLAAFVLR